MRALAVRELTVRAGERTVVDGVWWMLRAGELLGLTGPSGGGKTLTAQASLGLADLTPGVVSGTLTLHDGDGVRSWALTGDRRDRDARLGPLRGTLAVYLPQDADRGLDPLRRVGDQVRRAARGDEPGPWLARAGFAEPAGVLDAYPHALSGGMARRVGIASALARGTPFLLVDEPTTGLDPVTADRVAGTLRAIARDGVGVLWITHDLDRLCELADRAIVLADGAIAEVMDTVALRRRSPSGAIAHELLAAAGGDW